MKMTIAKSKTKRTKDLFNRGNFTHARFSKANLTVFAIIFAAIGGYFIYSSFAAAPAGTANLWVDSSGGSCTYHAAPASYVDSEACSPSNFDAIYAKAACGDTVKIKAEVLSDITMSGSPKTGCSSNVEFIPADGETVTISGSIDIDGPSYMTFKDIAAQSPGSGSITSFCNGITESPSRILMNTNESRTSVDSNHITFDHLTGFKKFGFYGWIEDITVRNSTFGPACDNQPQINTYDGSTNEVQRPRRVTIENNIFHDFARSSSSSHTECLQILSSADTIVRDNVMYNCAGTAAIGVTNGPHQNLLIENNTLQVGTGDAFYACQITRNQNGTTGLIVRHNSADKGCTLSDTDPYTHILYEGNYMPFSNTCIDQSINNVYEGGACNASDKNVSSLVFADAANHNLHLTTSSTDAIGAEATCSVTTDIDGDTRPATNCDAGADQLVAGPPDTTAPTVSLTAPTNGSTVSSTTAVSANASDDISVAGVQFKLDGANLGSEDTSSPYSVSWNSALFTNGSHTLTAVARDGVGNTTTSSSVTVTVSNAPDTTAPTVSMTAPANGATVFGSSVTVSASASDNVAVSGIQFKIDGANLGSEDTISPYSTTWNASGASNGTHTISAVARDPSGNTSTSSVTVTVSTPTTILGSLNLTSTSDFNPPGVSEAFSYTASSSGQTNQLGVYIDTGNTAPTVVAGIYSNNSGAPGTLLASGSASITGTGWVSVNLSQSVNLTGGQTYWIAILGPSGNLHYLDTSGGTSSPSSSSSSLSSLPSTWSSGTSYSAGPASVYAVQTGSAAPKVGDINNDGSVDIFDLSILLSNYNTAAASCDLNSDSTVNIFDLSILLSHYGM